MVSDVDVTIINRRDAANAVIVSLDIYNSLINFASFAKSAPLKGYLTGFWSRGIDDVNRLVYQVTETDCGVLVLLA